MHCSFKLRITSRQDVWGAGQDWSGFHRFFLWVWKYRNQQWHRPHLLLPRQLPPGQPPSDPTLLRKVEIANAFHGLSTYHTTKEQHLHERRTKQQNQLPNVRFLFWNSVLFPKSHLLLHKALHQQNTALASSLPLHSPLKQPGPTTILINHCWTKGIFRQHRLLIGINEQKCKLKQL